MSFPSQLCTGEHCDAAFFWAITPDGKRMPIDLEPSPTGMVIIDTSIPATHQDGAPYIARMEKAGQLSILMPGEERFDSHFATCPDAKSFRR